jgi:hypothetical protein
MVVDATQAFDPRGFRGHFEGYSEGLLEGIENDPRGFRGHLGGIEDGEEDAPTKCQQGWRHISTLTRVMPVMCIYYMLYDHVYMRSYFHM